MYAKCLYDYSPVQEDELALTAGKVVTVSKQESDGWWEGELDSRQGRFPGNYVEVWSHDVVQASPFLCGMRSCAEWIAVMALLSSLFDCCLTPLTFLPADL